MGKVVLITGGTGFLGTNLVKKLVLSNYAQKLVIVDNFITSNKNNIEILKQEQEQNFAEALEKNEITLEVLPMDICDNQFYKTVINKYDHIDEIYHFASLASPPFYKKYPLETLDVGYIGTRNMLDICKYYMDKNGKNSCKLLFASTSEVYGDALQHPQKESYYGNVNSYGTRCCYDESKRVAESLIYTYKQLYNVNTRIVRIFNTYGPFMNLYDGRIVTEIIKSLLLKKKLNIYGDGTQTRSLAYVDDTLDMIIEVMKSSYSEPVNVGNNKELNINEMVKIIQKIYKEKISNDEEVDKTLEIEYVTLEKDDPKVRQPHLDLIHKVMKNNGTIFKRTELEEGLYKTMVYFLNVVSSK